MGAGDEFSGMAVAKPTGMMSDERASISRPDFRNQLFRDGRYDSNCYGFDVAREESLFEGRVGVGGRGELNFVGSQNFKSV